MIDFEIKTARPSTVMGSKYILTTLSNHNSLQKLPSSLSKTKPSMQNLGLGK